MENLRKYKRIFLVLGDLFIVGFSYYLALLLAYDFLIPAKYTQNQTYPLLLLFVYFAGFALLGLYSSIWTVAGFFDYMNIVTANFATTIVVLILDTLMSEILFSTATILIASGYILLGTMGIRMFFRIYRRLKFERHPLAKERQRTIKRVLIVGAGDSAAMIIKEIKQHVELGMDIVGLVDDSPFKQHAKISGIKVLGMTEDIPEMVEEYKVDEILLAIPSASNEARRRILEIASSTKVKLKTLPGVYEMVEKGINVSSIRDVEISDLLGRKEIKLSNELIEGYIKEKVVLVTGGGGSIGSELCRQIAALDPKKLIIVDIYENNAYDIQMELQRRYPDLDLLVLIASVRDKKRIEKIFEKYRPQIVFHAAAHKHVPLMEVSPDEAIKNNVFGTLNVSLAARDYHAEKFILISTDKAVNPTNIMGATKRLCEMIVQTMDIDSTTTEFVAVRFGNVLGSNGSVIPLFKEQIKNGGPVTLTHKDIVRYFMTIPEAVQLVLQAGSYAHGGEIFVLDMGDPVKIYDLAENLIKLSGFEPHKDIEIKVTGLRPGEKLYEELLMAEEGLESTPNNLIFVGRPNGFDKNTLRDKLINLKEQIIENENTVHEVKKIMSEIVTTYAPDLNDLAL